MKEDANSWFNSVPKKNITNFMELPTDFFRRFYEQTKLSGTVVDLFNVRKKGINHHQTL